MNSQTWEDNPIVVKKLQALIPIEKDEQVPDDTVRVTVDVPVVDAATFVEQIENLRRAFKRNFPVEE